MTSKGLVTWDDSHDEDSFVRDDRLVGIAKKGIFGFILESVDGDGVAPYRLVVRRVDRQSNVAHTIAIIEMEAVDKGGDREVNGMIEALYADAVRRARRSDEDVRELFQTLDEIEADEPPF